MLHCLVSFPACVCFLWSVQVASYVSHHNRQQRQSNLFTTHMFSCNVCLTGQLKESHMKQKSSFPRNCMHTFHSVGIITCCLNKNNSLVKHMWAPIHKAVPRHSSVAMRNSVPDTGALGPAVEALQLWHCTVGSVTTATH